MDAPYDCQMCDKRVEPDQPDPCFGTLPGVTYACCGHGLGVPNRAYITFENGTTVYWGFYNRTTKKILWYSATATEVTNATDLSAFTGTFEVIGK